MIRSDELNHVYERLGVDNSVQSGDVMRSSLLASIFNVIIDRLEALEIGCSNELAQIFRVEDGKIKNGTYETHSDKHVYVGLDMDNDKHITLDGMFTLEELEFFVGIMKKE